MALTLTANLIEPTDTVGGDGHPGYRPLVFAPNQTYKDFTSDSAPHQAAMLQEA